MNLQKDRLVNANDDILPSDYDSMLERHQKKMDFMKPFEIKDNDQVGMPKQFKQKGDSVVNTKDSTAYDPPSDQIKSKKNDEPKVIM